MEKDLPFLHPGGGERRYKEKLRLKKKYNNRQRVELTKVEISLKYMMESLFFLCACDFFTCKNANCVRAREKKNTENKKRKKG